MRLPKPVRVSFGVAWVTQAERTRSDGTCVGGEKEYHVKSRSGVFMC